MRYAEYSAPSVIKIKHMEKPSIQSPSDVLVRICYTGICDDDLPFYLKDDSLITWPLPTAMTGHEFSGIVEDIGSDAIRNGFRVGDRVSGHAWNFCGACTNCKAGNENHCLNIKCTSTYVDYAVFDQRQIIHLPENVSLENGIFTDAISYCLYNCLKITPQKMKYVLISGSSTFSFVILQIMKRFGAYKIVLATSDLSKADLAYSLGADEVLPLSESFIPKALKLTQYAGYDLVFEVSRDVSMLTTLSQLVGIKGTILYSYMYGLNAHSRISLMEMYLKEAELHPFYLSCRTLPKAIEMMEKMNLSALIGKIYPFEEINTAFQAHLSRKYVQVILDMQSPA